MKDFRGRFGVLVLLSVFGYALSFVSQLIIAYYFGTSQVLDGYWGCLALVNLLSFYMMPLKEALVPAVHRARERGGREAGQVLSAGLSLLLGLGALSALIFCLLVWSGNVIGIGAESALGSGVSALLPWLLPYLFLFILAETLSAILVSFNQVLQQAILRIIAAVALVATVAIVGDFFGVAGLLLAQIICMATLVVMSAAALRHLKIRLLFRVWGLLKDSGMVPLFVSLLLSYVFSQIYVFAERTAMIHLEPGLVSSFQYSVGLVNALVSLVAFPLSNLLWSQFLKRAADGEHKMAQVTAIRACGVLCYFLIVVCTFVWVNAPEIVGLLYGGGAFDENSIQKTATALRNTIFTAIPISLMSVLGRWLMSQSGAHRQLWIGLATTFVGLSVIGVAVHAGSGRFIQFHWLLANLAGMVVSGRIFVSTAEFTRAQTLVAIRWLLLVILVAVCSAWIMPSIVFGESKASLLGALIVEGGAYLLGVFGLTWIFRMLPSLRGMLGRGA